MAAMVLKLTWEVAALNTLYDQEAEQAAAYYADRTHEYISKSCVNKTDVAFYRCADDIVKASREAQTAQRDLAAQQGMRFWAMAMFWATAASVASTLFGIYYVRKTLQTNVSLLEIERTPFLSIRPVDAERIRWDPVSGRIGKLRDGSGTDVDYDVAIFCEIKSGGKNPVILTGISRNWVASTVKKPPDIIEFPKHKKEVSIPIGPDGIVMATDSEFLVEWEDPTHEPWITFYGYITFTDISGDEEYISGFAFNYNPDNMYSKRGLVTARFEETKPHWYYCKLKSRKNSW